MTPKFWIMVLVLSAVVIGSSVYLRIMSGAGPIGPSTAPTLPAPQPSK